jgi:hypothetical protein
MPETQDPNEAFKQYLKEKEGQPIDTGAVAAANRELAVGAKSDFAVVRNEPDRETKMRTYPKGHEFKTDMSEGELKKAVDELTSARQVIINHLEHSKDIPILKNPEETSLYELEKRAEELPEDFAKAFQRIKILLDPDGEMLLFDLPEEIKDTISNYKKALSGMQEK